MTNEVLVVVFAVVIMAGTVAPGVITTLIAEGFALLRQQDESRSFPGPERQAAVEEAQDVQARRIEELERQVDFLESLLQGPSDGSRQAPQSGSGGSTRTPSSP